MSETLSVTLYRMDDPLWMTDASISHDDSLVITTGGRHEKFLTVAADRKGFVLDALLRHVTPTLPASASADERLLAALAEKFAGDSDPFKDIEAFLRATNNLPRKSTWLDLS